MNDYQPGDLVWYEGFIGLERVNNIWGIRYTRGEFLIFLKQTKHQFNKEVLLLTLDGMRTLTLTNPSVWLEKVFDDIK
jgi:hypothetical protein